MTGYLILTILLILSEKKEIPKQSSYTPTPLLTHDVQIQRYSPARR